MFGKFKFLRAFTFGNVSTTSGKKKTFHLKTGTNERGYLKNNILSNFFTLFHFPLFIQISPETL